MTNSGSRNTITTSVLFLTHHQRYQHGLFIIINFIDANIINFATLALNDYIIINKLSYHTLECNRACVLDILCPYRGYRCHKRIEPKSNKPAND
jgi:hypothetical protein